MADKFPIDGGENRYSTTEKKIGEWTDGKPIYQKVFTGTTPNGSTVTELDISVGASVDNYINIISSFLSSAKSFVPLPIVSDSKRCYVVAYPNSHGTSSLRNKIRVRNNNTEWGGASLMVICQYTKTTD